MGGHCPLRVKSRGWSGEAACLSGLSCQNPGDLPSQGETASDTCLQQARHVLVPSHTASFFWFLKCPCGEIVTACPFCRWGSWGSEELSKVECFCHPSPGEGRPLGIIRESPGRQGWDADRRITAVSGGGQPCSEPLSWQC